MDKHQTSPDNADRFREWFKTRGGIAVWPSINLSNPGASWTTPALNRDGTPTKKPTWQASNTPRIITDPSEVEVLRPKEVKRFHVGLRRSNGPIVKITDAATKRVRREVEKAGPGAWYEFDYWAQDAVILVPDGVEAL